MMRWIPVLILFAASGCFFHSSNPSKAAPKQRPGFKPLGSTGEIFEGPVRVHSRGTQGDALGCDLSQKGNLIAFSWNNNNPTPKIYSLSTGGKRPVQLTFGDWSDIQPEFFPSQDGSSKKIAYATNKEGNFDIYMISMSGKGGAYQLTSSGADEMHPAFSPDGRYLTFCRLAPDGTWRIWKKNLKTQQPTCLGPGKNPEWSPAGDKIAFQLPVGRVPEKIWSIWVMTPDGTNRKQIEAAPDYGTIVPSWSPDGRYLVYTRIPLDAGSPPSGDIWAEHLETGSKLRLTTTASTDTDPCWGLDGWIYFSSTRTTGRFNIISGRFDPELLKRP